MPYLDYGGVCHADSLDASGRGAADAELIAHARELASKLRAKRLHIRSLMRMQPPFEISTEKVAQHLALSPTVDEQMRRLPSERRNRLKRIEKLGLGVEVGDPTAPSALADFCATYSENMRDLGSPTHGRRFFSDLVSRLPRLSVADSRTQRRPRGRGRPRDEFPRLDDAAVVGRDIRRRVRCMRPTRFTGKRYNSASRPVAIPSISGDLHLAQESSNSSGSGVRRRCSHTGARYIFRRARRRRASARACRLSAGCGVTCRSESRARLDRDCGGGFQIELDSGGAIWNREGGGRAVADAPQCVSVDRRDSHSGADSAQPRVSRDQGARSAGKRHAAARRRHRPRRYRAALRAAASGLAGAWDRSGGRPGRALPHGREKPGAGQRDASAATICSTCRPMRNTI